MDFNPQQLEDFLKEESFVRWAHNPDDSSANFWEQWCIQHKEFADEVKQAKKVILGLAYKHKIELTSEELKEMFARIKSIASSEK